MNARKLLLIVLIFIVASVGWTVLGGTITTRTAIARDRLGRDVERMFGPEFVQDGPVLTSAPGATRGPDATAISCSFEHENRYRGLIWFSVFRVRFDATYRFDPPPSGGGAFRMDLPRGANLDGLIARSGGRDLDVGGGAITGELDFTAGPAEVTIRYASTGQDSWRYDPLGAGLRNFALVARTDFADIDYPSSGLSPTRQKARGGGREAIWEFDRLLPARNRVVGIVMPSRPAAGMLAARIADFAPVSLFFFLTVMVTIQLLRNFRLHPINYLLIAAAFFAFHILLAYLVDHVTIHVGFWVSAAVSVFLMTSYLRLVLGMRAAILVAGGAQMVYLVFFSYAFFWEGWTGLTVVIGAILTLFLIMQLTGRIDWDTRFPDLGPSRRRPGVAPAGGAS